MFKRLKETILEIIQQADLILLGLCCAASLFGIAMIYSATRYNAPADNRKIIVQTAALASAVRSSAPAAGNEQVFVPGERSALRRSEQLARGTVELEADVYDRIRAMSRSREGGYENSRSMN